MATVPAPARATPSNKYDTQIASQLAKAEQRVRFLDLVTGLLGFLALSLGFALVMVLIHWKLDLSTGARQAALVLYLLGAGAFLTWKVVLPLRRPINPRYAALQLEHTLPGAKNSVVNYIDLRNENLPAAIRGALSRRAAKDAVQADVEQAIPGKQASRAGMIAAGVAVLGLALMFAVGSRDFFRLLGGIFVPRSSVTTAPSVQQNRIVVRQPEGGNTTVAAGSALTFAVHVEGDLPAGDAQNPKLILTYPQSKDSVVRHMVRPRRAGGDWTADVSALEVRDGFTYKVTAGDAESEEYRVGVFFTPAVTDFKAVYTYPVYVGEPRLKVQTVNRRLQAWRGTEVALRVQTNGMVKEAQIEMTGKDGARRTIDAAIVADDREAFEARFVLQETGTYRLRFSSSRDEKYLDPLAYELIADLDLPPHNVELTKPGFDIRLPANGLLKVEGTTEDDIGVKSLALQMQIVDGPVLKAKAYRSDKELLLPGGGYLKALAYKDAVDLKTIQGEDGKPVALKAGMKLKYWLEARDACDYPRPKEIGEVGTSKHFFVTLTEPEPDPQKQQKDRDDAKKEQEKHQAKQDEEKNKEEQNRKEQQKQAEAEKNQAKTGTEEPQPKPDEPNQGNKPDNPRDADQQNAKNELDKKSEENERRAEEKKQDGNPESKEQPKDDKGQHKDDGKSGKEKPAESKPADPKQGGNQAEQQNKKGDAKPEGKDSDKKKPGECKACNNPGGQGQGKAEGKNDSMTGGQTGGGKGSSASGSPMMEPNGEKPGEAKNDTPSTPNEGASSSAAKGGDPKPGDGQTAKGKTGGTPPSEKEQPHGKEVGETGKVADNKPTGDSKDQQPDKGSPSPATAKEGGDKQGMGNESQAKSNDNGGAQDEKKPGPNQATGQDTASSKPEARKDDGGDVSKIDAKDPSRKDLENLSKALEKGDKEQVSKAQRKLEEIGEKANDPNTRESAKNLAEDLKKFIEEAQKQERDAAATPKPGTKPEQGPDTPADERVADTKQKPSDDGKEAGKSKEGQGDPKDKPGTEKGKGRKEQPGDPMTPPDGMGQKDDPTKATVKGPMNPLGRRDDAAEARNPEEAPKPGKPVNPLKQPNSILQLEKFDRTKYLDREDILTKKPPFKETKPTPGTNPAEVLNPNKGSPLPNLSGRNTEPNTTTTNPFDAGRAPPPPGYGNAASKLTKILAEPEKK